MTTPPANDKNPTRQGDPSDTAILRVAAISLLLNLILVAVKFGLSALSGSLTLRADAVHSMVDVFASVALIIGLKIATRKNPDFPYGLYKVENVISVGIAFLIFLTAYELVIEALRGSVAPPAYEPWVLVAVFCLIPVPYLFGRYQTAVGRLHGSPSLIADGNQHKADVLSSSIVFFAVVGQYFAVPLDRIAAVIIAVFIVVAGFEILKDGMRVLLDASVDHTVLDEVRGIIMSEPAVTEVSTVTGRNSGRYIFIEANVSVRITNLERAHLISERIEQKIKERLPNVERMVIHYEPQKKTTIRYAVALGSMQGDVSSHFGESPHFAILDFSLEEPGLIRQEILQNPYSGDIKGKGIKVAGMLLEQKPDIVVTMESLQGKGPGYALAEAGVETETTDQATLSGVIQGVLARLRAE